ncbi:MAG TPA: glycoside hydrolase family 88 protein [Anaerohalosphaeraceae bacterium]|nr:glycoside hydrolase family 88 protein [Anaerohalosphaeraceae bacterium]
MKQKRMLGSGRFLLTVFAVFWICGFPAAALTEEEGWQSVPEILARIQPPTFPERDFVITDYGAVGDGKTVCTEAFRKAIAACHQAGGGRVVVPEGTFLTGPIHLKSGVNLHLKEGAVVRFSSNPADYLPVVFTRFEGTECMNYSPLIYAFEQENIAITGSGVLDGSADEKTWWPWKAAQKTDVQNLVKQGEQGVPVAERVYGEGHYLRPNMVQPYRCKNILIEGVMIRSSPMWHIHPVLSQNITVRNVKVIGHGPNNDGCNPESCRDVLIEGCYFDTGDDCIAIKSGRNNDGRRVNVPSENIIVRNCTMKDGHGGVVLGSEISGSVRNVFVEDCLMDSPNLDRGLRFKTNSVRGGVIERIFMRNVEMRQVREAALKIDFYYEEGDSGPFKPIVRDIFMTNVVCRKSKYPWHIRGYPHSPVQNVVLKGCVFENAEKEGVAEAVESFLVLPKDKPAASTERWSERMIRSEMTRNPQAWMIDFSPKPRWKYPSGLMMKAIWTAGILYDKPEYLEYVKSYYDILITDDGQILTYDAATYNIDNINPGKTLIDVYLRSPQAKYRKAIEALREQMRTHPRTSEGGFWHKKIYPHQMWLDGLYMGAAFLAQYAAVFEEKPLFDDVARQFVLMEKHARDPKTGLLYHGWDESRTQKWADPSTGCSPHFWGRAMGWYAMALIDTLDYFPTDHPQRKELVDILNRLMEAVVKVQDPKTGVWYQIVDKPNEKGNYLESSCSAMFVYSLLKGIRKGYLPSSMTEAAEKGYAGILKEFVEVAADGQVHLHKGCAVAGLGGSPYRDGSFNYYISEPVRSNDPKAVEPFILASLEMEMKAGLIAAK